MLRLLRWWVMLFRRSLDWTDAEHADYQTLPHSERFAAIWLYSLRMFRDRLIVVFLPLLLGLGLLHMLLLLFAER